MRKLIEGGNLTVSGSKGAQSATKLLTTKMNPDMFEDFKTCFIDFLLEMNDEYEKYSGRPIWKDTSKITSGNLFSGSSRTFFQKPFEEYSRLKPKVGDFDVQISDKIDKENFFEFLEEMVDKKVGKSTFYVYGNQMNFSQAHSLICASELFPGVGADYIQVDWEFVPYEEDDSSPTQFSTFAHYSSWEDLENNVKGLFVKFLIRALTALCDLRDICLVTPKGKISNNALARQEFKNFRSFSVDKGIRCKFKPWLDENGEIELDEKGREKWYGPIKCAESTYTQSLPEFFQLIFKRQPKNDTELKDMYSYIRLLKRIKKELSPENIDATFLQFIEYCYGKTPNGQVLSAFDLEEDKGWKVSAINKFYEIIPETKKFKKEVDEKINAYYENLEPRKRGDMSNVKKKHSIDSGDNFESDFEPAR